MRKSAKTKLLFATVSPAALALVGSAGAADLPRKAPAAVVAPAPIPYSWTGCYVGLSGGYGWGKQNVTRNQFFFSSGSFAQSSNVGISTQGGVFGGQIGCNYQFASNWLVGVEGAFAGADIHKSVLDPFTGGTITAKTNFLGSATVRLGYLTWNNQMLWYVKGGMGAARNKLETSLDLTNISNDRVGWTVGAGWEYMFAPSWSVFIDYQYYGFNSGNGGGVTVVTPGFPNVADTFTAGSQHINVIKGGINWKFTGP